MRGFTLLELLIVIALLSLVMVFVMPNIKNIRDEQGLSSAALELQSNLRSAQNNALSGLKCTSSAQSAVNWQLNLIDDKNYQIEANCLDGTSPTKQYSLSTYNVIVELVNGCSNVTRAGVTYSNVLGIVSFTPPAGCTASSSLEFSLKVANNNNIAAKKVVVDQGGRVYVQ